MRQAGVLTAYMHIIESYRTVPDIRYGSLLVRIPSRITARRRRLRHCVA